MSLILPKGGNFYRRASENRDGADVSCPLGSEWWTEISATERSEVGRFARYTRKRDVEQFIIFFLLSDSVRRNP